MEVVWLLAGEDEATKGEEQVVAKMAECKAHRQNGDYSVFSLKARFLLEC